MYKHAGPILISMQFRIKKVIVLIFLTESFTDNKLAQIALADLDSKQDMATFDF